LGALTERTIQTAKAGRLGDGDGLFLVVSKSGRKKWVFRYQVGGVRKDKGLGPYPEIGLKEARIRAAKDRSLIVRGVDPIAARRAAQKAARPVPTFADIAALVVADAQSRSMSAKGRSDWARYLGPAYCGPLLGRPVSEITTLDVAAVLRPVWRLKPEAARKLYPAIRRVFERARIILRDEHSVTMPDNPARWRAMGFEAPAKLSKGSHPSLPYAQMPAFMAALRGREGVAARALEFLIQTNVRTDAALKASWRDFDLNAAVWTVPLASLKDRKHRAEGFRVPLPPRAVAIVREMDEARSSAYVFPGQRWCAPLSHTALLMLLKRMNAGEKRWIDPARERPITAHGFRASFKTWAEEVATFPHAVVELAMGHQVGGAVERAYRRSVLLEQRRRLMDAWAAHCEPRAGSSVVPLRPRR
jgi:integrase